MPRICHRQQHQSNSHCSDPKKYFKVTVLVPFLDHSVAGFNARFWKSVQKVARLQAVLPTSISERCSFDDIKEVVDFYLQCWLAKPWHCWWGICSLVEKMGQYSFAVLSPSPERLPGCWNLHDAKSCVLLQLFATLPLSTCSCKNSASALRLDGSTHTCTALRAKTVFLP